MRLNKGLTLFFFSILFTACGMSCAFSSRTNPKPEKVQVREQALIVDIGMQSHIEYVVRERIDLQGRQVNVPEGVTITFKKGGSIVNGTLNGNGTKLNSKTDEVLSVKLKGTWCVDRINDLVFSKEYLTDTDIINNLNSIQSDDIANEVTINRDYYIAIAKSGGAGLLPSSHSTILLKGTISLEGNDYKSYKIIDINNKIDVTIRGGQIIGDVGCHSYIEGTTSEWGMGISIINSRDIQIIGTYISKCTGDGVYISGYNEPSVGFYNNASKNVIIKGVVCDNNRRQGMSVIHVDGLIVRECQFINTGQIEGTAPSAGVDIEPDVKHNCNMSVRNVEFDNCIISNNVGMAVATSTTFFKEGLKNHESIVFSNCMTDGQLRVQSDDVTFQNCSFKEVRIACEYTQTHISFINCSIRGGYGVLIYAPSTNGVRTEDRLLYVDFNKCTIELSDSIERINSLIRCYKSYIPNIGSINIEDCSLILPSSQNFHLTDCSFKGKLHINSSVINMPGNTLDATGIMLSNNILYCRSVINGQEDNFNSIIKNK